MKKMLISLVLVFNTIWASETGFEIQLTNVNNAKTVYDAILPVLMRYALTETNDSIQTQIDKVSHHISFITNPGMFDRYNGLGTKSKYNFQNISMMLMSGNVLCSEQSALAVMAFSSDLDTARRDVASHTFHELFVDGRWIIVDPINDMHLKNKNGKSVTFDEILQYAAGDVDILMLAKKPKERIMQYVRLFEPSNFDTNASNEVRETSFGNQKIYPKEELHNIGMQVAVYRKALLENGEDIENNISTNYIINYIKPNIINLIKNSPNPKNVAYAIQDLLLAEIVKDFKKNYLLFPEGMVEDFIASQYIVTARYENAKVILEGIDAKDDEVKFDLSRVYFKIKDTKSFLKYKKALKHNIYYKIMYHQMIGNYLSVGDQKEFDSFPHLDAYSPL